MKYLILAFLVIFHCAQGTNYCEKSLCYGAKHIGCKNNGKLARSCASTSVMIDLSKYKEKFVDLHNQKRNKVASGSLKPYAPAQRMATMTWDDELSYLAGLNLKTCKFAHDSCRNTDAFKFSGQNLAYWAGYPAITVDQAIEQTIEGWFKEYTNADMSVIRKYRISKNPYKPNGHFTVMVADRNIKVGCALRKAVEGKWTKYFVACNYATTNMMDHPIYKESSKAASGCKSGHNPKYPALCSVSEVYDVNNWF